MSAPRRQASGRHASRRYDSRRNLLIAIGLVTSSAATGCGFRLRGSVGLPFQSIFVDAPRTSGVAAELSRQLVSLQQAQGGTKLTSKASEAQVILRVITEAREKEVLGFSTSGAQRDYQVRLRFRYEVLDARKPLGAELGERIGEPIELVLRRDVSTIDSQLTAKQEEDVLLFREMQSDIVQQVLTRLAALKFSLK
jgi:LPS-assembly lipoprotein